MKNLDLSLYATRTLAALQAAGETNAADKLQALVLKKFSLQDVIACAIPASEHSQSDSDRVGEELRRIRQWLMLALFYADVQQLITPERVCELMTEFAAFATQTALLAVAKEISDLQGTPVDEFGLPQDLLVMAMGKAGANELNVSSDLDIVFIHRSNPYPKGDTDKGHSSSSVLETIAQRTVQLLQKKTDTGFVFRIDTRLRPFGDGSPLIVSLSMFESYLVSHGREWERFAWLKASLLTHTEFAPTAARTQDIADLKALLTPFIYRRYLDFQAIDALKDLHRKIAIQASTKSINFPANQAALDVKVGRGGIREIEFIAQLFQIIRGGKQTHLRLKSTVESLRTLASDNIISQAQSTLLIDAYWFWRRTEHALQFRDDQQTHLLKGDDHPIIAAMLGFEVDQFALNVQRFGHEVAGIFDSLLGESPIDLVNSTPSSSETSAEVSQRISLFKSSRKYLHATEPTIRLLDELLKSICHDTQSSKALLTMIELLETLSGRPNYLTLMVRFPAVRQRVLRLIDRASWASLYLMQHPIVLDELLGDAWLAPVDFEKWANRLATQLASIDTEAALDLLREAHHAQVFRLLAQDIEGLISTEHLSDHLSLLADKVVGLMIQVVWQKIQATPSKRMLKRAQPEFAVIAYGKLGGKELGYASDLDLVFIFDKHDDPEDQAEETYAVLSQRLSGYLSMRTSAGILFDVDTRLRPNGASGLITISMAAFSKYQTSAAWVWEHQALTRARFCAGDDQLGATFEAQRCELLSRPRDVATLKAEVITMRQKIHQGHPNKTELFDIKHDSGAMIDIEFVVQYLVLAHAHKHSKLLENSGNIALLHVAAEAGLIEASLAHRCADAYRRFRQLQHALRLNDQTNGNAACRVPHSDIAEHRQAVLTLWALVMTSA